MGKIADMCGILCLITFSIFCTLLCGASYTPKVVYVTFSRPLTVSPARRGPGTRLRYVSNADDTPFEKIELPFRFPFFGKDLSRVYASPNGALHLRQDPPCGNVFMWDGCFLDDYTGLVGILVTDFDLSISPQSNATVYSDEHEVHVAYDRALEFGANPLTSERYFSFSTSLFYDGSLTLKYAHIPDMGNVELWWSGIRPEEPYGNTFIITSEQQRYGERNYGTSTLGVYANIKDVESNNRETVFCPLSTTWCLTPSVIFSESLPEQFKFTPLSMSCIEDIQIGYYYDSADPATATTPCSLNTSALYPFYVCTSVSIPSNLGTTVTIHLAWRYVNESGSFKTFEAPAFNINIVNDKGSVAGLYQNSDVNNCTTNTGACGGAECDICHMELQCLGLPCTDKVSGLPDLYANFSCDGTCATTYEEGGDDVCCNNAFIDCAGTCNGTAVPALILDGEDTYACCLSGLVDCFNRCDGNGAYDSCGVCRLPESVGDICETFFSVDNDVIYEFYSAEYNASAVEPIVNSYNLTFSNSNETDVVFSIQLFKSDESKAPEVFLPGREFLVPAFSNITVLVQSSITKLLSGNISRWEAKTLRVLFGRPELYSYRIVLDVKLYPDTLNCGIVSSRSTCISLPGCMHCYNNPGYRVLYSAEEECMANVSGVNESNQCARRDLFSNVIPSSTNADIGDPKKNGICKNGWRTTNCDNFEYRVDVKKYETTSSIHISIGACIFFAFFSATFYIFSY